MPRQDQDHFHAIFWAAPNDAIFDSTHVAAGLTHSVEWLRERQATGNGPPAIRAGRKYLFRKGDVLAWLSHASESQPSKAREPRAGGVQ